MFNGHRVYNLTPHAITLVDAEGAMLENFPPSGRVARVTMEGDRPVKNRFNLPAVEFPTPGEIMTGGGGLEDVSFHEFSDNDNELFIVSRMVLDALVSQGYNYQNVFAPDTGSTAKRNEQGQVIGVIRFISAI